MHLGKKQVAAILPYTGMFIVFCGIIKGILFYNQFHVRIVSFIEFSEFVTLFLNDIMYYGIYFIVLELFLFISNNRQQAVNMDQKRLEIIIKPNPLKRLWGYIKFLWPLSIAMVIIIIAFILPIFITPVNGNDLSLLKIHFFSFIALFVFLIGSFEFNRQYFIYYKQFPDATYMNLIGIAFVFLSIVVSSAYTDAYSVKHFKKYFGTKVVLDNTILISDSTQYFIGKTNNYIFFYNEKNNNSSAIPTSRVKEISFPK